MKNESKGSPTNDDTLLRDMLAADRTVLSNERTLLAYIRTALTLLVAGLSILKFFESGLLEILAWLLITMSAFIQVVGIVRYAKMRRAIAVIRKNKRFDSDTLQQ